jgi:uncharacterized delta-60 repeat protein
MKKTIKIITLLLFANNILLAQSIYSNGSLKTGTVSKSGDTAPAGTEWSELQNDVGNFLVSNNATGYSNQNILNRLADDFIVPPGQTWNISKFSFLAYQTGVSEFSSPFNGLFIRVWNGRPGDAGSFIIFGDLTTNRLTSSTDIKTFRIFNSLYPDPGNPVTTTRFIWKNTANVSLNLTQGTYWIEWTTQSINNNNLFCPSTTVLGQRKATPLANARQLTLSTGLWADVVDAGIPSTPPSVKQDFPFEIVYIGVNLNINFISTNGKITSKIGSSNEVANAINITSTGKILTAGFATNAVTNTSNTDFAIIGHNANGSYDLSFGLSSFVKTDITASSFDHINAIAIQTFGKIIAVGKEDQSMALVRYNANGTLDNTFGTLGISKFIVDQLEPEATSIAIQTDGKIVVSAFNYEPFYGDYFAILVRFNANGTIDNTFGTSGVVDLPNGSGFIGKSLALQTDGKIVVACESKIGTGNFVVIRTNSNGSIDNTFGTGGTVTTTVGTGHSFAKSLVLQTDGKILVAGSAKDNALDAIGMVRYNSNGSLDNTFDTDGKVLTNFGPTNVAVTSAAIQPDGRIYVTGNTISPSNSDIMVAKYTSTGALDLNFDYDGKLILPLGSGNDGANAIISNTNGEALLAGFYHNGTDSDFALVKIVDCKQYVNLSLQNPTDNYPNPLLPINQNGNIINANNLINTPANVIFKATNSITLNPGFKANSGSVFKTELVGCSY